VSGPGLPEPQANNGGESPDIRRWSRTLTRTTRKKALAGYVSLRPGTPRESDRPVDRGGVSLPGIYTSTPEAQDLLVTLRNRPASFDTSVGEIMTFVSLRKETVGADTVKPWHC